MAEFSLMNDAIQWEIRFRVVNLVCCFSRSETDRVGFGLELFVLSEVVISRHKVNFNLNHISLSFLTENI